MDEAVQAVLSASGRLAATEIGLDAGWEDRVRLKLGAAGVTCIQ
jgi:hypothetical protein